MSPQRRAYSMSVRDVGSGVTTHCSKLSYGFSYPDRNLHSCDASRSPKAVAHSPPVGRPWRRFRGAANPCICSCTGCDSVHQTRSLCGVHVHTSTSPRERKVASVSPPLLLTESRVHAPPSLLSQLSAPASWRGLLVSTQGVFLTDVFNSLTWCVMSLPARAFRDAFCDACSLYTHQHMVTDTCGST